MKNTFVALFTLLLLCFPALAKAEDDNTRSLTITAISNPFDIDNNLQIKLRISAGDELKQPRLTYTVHKPVETSDELLKSIDSVDLGWIFSSGVEDVEPVLEGESQEINFEKSLSSLYLDKYDATGIYPLQFTLSDGANKIAELVVPIIVSPTWDKTDVTVIGDGGTTYVVTPDTKLRSPDIEYVFEPKYKADITGLAASKQQPIIDSLVEKTFSNIGDESPRIIAPIGDFNSYTAQGLSRVKNLEGILIDYNEKYSSYGPKTLNGKTIYSGQSNIIDASNRFDDIFFAQWLRAQAVINATDNTPMIIDLRPIDSSARREQIIQTVHEEWANLVPLSELTSSAQEYFHAEYAAIENQRIKKLKKIELALQSVPFLSNIIADDSPENPLLSVNKIDDQLFEDMGVEVPDSHTADIILETEQKIRDSLTVLVPPPITLTGKSGAIPISIANDSDTPLKVLVTLNSNGLSFINGNEYEVVLKPKDATTIEITAVARQAGGLARAIVSIRHLKTKEILAEDTISVRSMAYPVSALAGALVAAILLGFSLLKRRPTAKKSRR